MGGISGAIGGLGGPVGTSGGTVGNPMGLGGATLEAKVEHLTKLVHILWKEAERLESMVQVIPEGLRIKTGVSEVLVLRNGGIRIDGLRILVNTPGKSEFYF